MFYVSICIHIYVSILFIHIMYLYIITCLKKFEKFREDAGSQKTIILFFEFLSDSLLNLYCFLHLYSEIQ